MKAKMENTARRFGRLAFAAAAFAAFALFAEDEAYQFIISGDPEAAAATAASHYGTSDGGALAAGCFSERESEGGRLYSTEFRGFYIIFR